MSLMAHMAVITAVKKHGGSIVIAETMHSLGKRVFAVPGNPNRINSEGCNKLIRQGTAEILADYSLLRNV